MKKLILAPMTLSLLALTLIGCGEGEEAIYGSEGSNSFTFNSFEKVTNGQTDAVARIEQTYSRGEHKAVTRSIVNRYTGKEPNTQDKVVLASYFEGNLYNADIEVDKRIVKRAIYERNSNKKYSYETTYEAYDLSGKQTLDYIVGTTVNNSRGIFTDLNKYPNIPATATFPTGSVCYVPVTSSDIRFWAFDIESPTKYQALGEWVTDTKNYFGSNKKPLRTTFLVGKDNQYQLEQIKFFAENNQPEYVYNGVEYGNNKNIYEADYVTNGINKPNTDIKNAVVYCNLVNNIAADFLTEQIKISYRR
jgi:hypothetical protein